jgi:epoxyqueuosine reductase
MEHLDSSADWAGLAAGVKAWGQTLGFDAIGIAGTDLGEAEARLLSWLAQGRHGRMDYMARHGNLRARPQALVPGTLSVITARMNYWPDARDAAATLADATLAYVSRYALGRDYHKIMRSRLQRLAERIREDIGEFAFRAFADSAPVMEVELAARSGLGWRGKHTLLLDRAAGSWFFLGEIYTNLPLPPDAPVPEHCGTCARCIDVCPTGAIVAPYRLDARLCISYLTIEHDGPIPPELRPLIGNRIYGCDDCQLFCPWNRSAPVSGEADFRPRNRLDAASLLELFAWSEEEFERRLQGSPIRRIGHVRWLRNLAVCLGNAPPDPAIVRALQSRLDHPSELVREHVAWALERQTGPAAVSGEAAAAPPATA